MMMPGSAIGRISRSEIVSRPKNRERQTAAAARVPSTSASSVDTAATCSDSASASQMSCRAHATANQRSGEAGRREDEALVLGAERVEHDEDERDVQEQHAQPRPPAPSGHAGLPARRGAGASSAQGLEGAQAAGHGQIDGHDRDRHDGQRRRQRDVAGGALVLVDGLADEGLRSRR